MTREVVGRDRTQRQIELLHELVRSGGLCSARRDRGAPGNLHIGRPLVPGERHAPREGDVRHAGDGGDALERLGVEGLPLVALHAPSPSSPGRSRCRSRDARARGSMRCAGAARRPTSARRSGRSASSPRRQQSALGEPGAGARALQRLHAIGPRRPQRRQEAGDTPPRRARRRARTPAPASRRRRRRRAARRVRRSS